jgi:drug/metabolite transporter (DMT)-like permease
MITTGVARLSVLGAALFFSTGGAAIKGTAMTPFQVAGFRSGVAALAIALLLPAARRGFGLALLPAALAYAATLVLFVMATKLTTAASAIFLQSTAPIWVLLLAPALLREPIRRADLPYVAMAAIGLLLVFLGSRDPMATAPEPALGNTLALGSGLAYALLMMLMRRLARGGDATDRSLAAMVLGNVIAFLVCMPFSLPVVDVTAHDVGAIIYLGVIQIGLAYWLFARGLRVLSALEISLLVLLEPVLNPLWTWILQGEEPSALALMGGAVMIAALAARALLDRNRADPPPDPPPPD